MTCDNDTDHPRPTSHCAVQLLLCGPSPHPHFRLEPGLPFLEPTRLIAKVTSATPPEVVAEGSAGSSADERRICRIGAAIGW